jgi:hypothetical protein
MGGNATAMRVEGSTSLATADWGEGGGKFCNLIARKLTNCDWASTPYLTGTRRALKRDIPVAAPRKANFT